MPIKAAKAGDRREGLGSRQWKELKDVPSELLESE